MVAIFSFVASQIPEKDSAKDPESRVFASVPDCAGTSLECSIIGPVQVSTGQGLATAYGVNKRSGTISDSESSTIVILNSIGETIWTSPFHPGYGLIKLETDVTNNLFATFAITNHSGVVWAMRVTPDGVEDFGTMGGTLPVNSVGAESTNGSKPLHASREGWPANFFNDETSRDVYVWDGSSYKYMGCEVFQPAISQDEIDRVIEAFDTSYEKCSRPMGKPSVGLDGSRENDSPVP